MNERRRTIEAICKKGDIRLTERTSAPGLF